MACWITQPTEGRRPDPLSHESPAIQHGGHSEGPLAPVGFRDEHPAHGRGAIRPFTELGTDALPVISGKCREVVDGHPINARRALVGLHLLPGKGHVRTVKHPLEQRVRIDRNRSMLSSILS